MTKLAIVMMIFTIIGLVAARPRPYPITYGNEVHVVGEETDSVHVVDGNEGVHVVDNDDQVHVVDNEDEVHVVDSPAAGPRNN
ncbi:unnamed protein product [Leptosia nina]|uniref:Uncharacterized protein n=1 Tax=Leptosia nina TaxID=320188 RepID=A0AAV1JSN4_9NEOP